MRLIGALFAAHVLPLQFFFRLRGAEQVGSQFGAAHVVENLLALLQTLARMNILRAQAAIQTLVTVILKNGVI